jgi:hypothetical protein
MGRAERYQPFVAACLLKDVDCAQGELRALIHILQVHFTRVLFNVISTI